MTKKNLFSCLLPKNRAMSTSEQISELRQAILNLLVSIGKETGITKLITKILDNITKPTND